MQLVIPMAGLGKRFADAGYTMPKPLIPVAGLPMVVRVAQNLPRATRTVFIVHPEHAATYPLAKTLTDHVPGAVVVVAPGLTEGQACSVRLAAEHLDPNDSVLVAACDSTQVYSASTHDALCADPSLDCLIWTYRGEPRVLVNPHWYGWVATNGVRVTRVSVKKPLSATPLHDHVVSGTFWFRKAKRMIDGIDELVRRNLRVNDEFYLDSVPALLLEAGRGVAVFEMDKYIGWGTPDDFRDYLRWQEHFRAQHLPGQKRSDRAA